MGIYLHRPSLTRVEPAHPRQAYRTYTLAVEDRELVSCQEARCPHWEKGWTTQADLATPIGRDRAELIRSGRTGRRYVEGRHQVDVADDGTVRLLFDRHPAGPDEPVVFWFPPRQKCFQDHVRPAGAEHYWVRDGDHRGGDLIRVHSRAVDWCEDMNEQSHRRAEARARG